MQYREIKKAVTRTKEGQPQVQEAVLSILEKVRQEGDHALEYYEKKFVHFEPETFLVAEQEAALAKSKLTGDCRRNRPG